MKETIYIILIILSYTNAMCQKWEKPIDDFLSTELSKFNIPSLEVLVVNKDSIVYSKSLGESTPNATYYIGSISKSLTAFGILKLIEQKKLNFNAKIIDIIPELQFHNSQEKITIWHLLTHTSGIRKKNGFSHLPPLKEIKGKKIKIVNKSIEPLEHEYSNLNYSLLGLVIERTTGLSFKDYMHQYVFQSIEMTDSKIGSRDELSQLISHYQYFGIFPIKSRQIDFATTSIPAGFICSSANDLGKYIQLNLSKGRLHNMPLIDSSLLQEMHTVWNKGEYGYAMGWKQGKYNNHKFYQHLGSTANSYSGIFFIPDKELGFVFLTNSNSLNFSESIAEGLLNILTNGEQKEVSWFEFLLRIGVLLGYLIIVSNFLIQLRKLTKNKLPINKEKQMINLLINISLLIALFFVFPLIAQIPLNSFLKIQPDIGYLILLSLIFPIVITIIKMYKMTSLSNKT